MGPIVVYNHVNVIDSEFKLAQQRLNEFVHPGQKGLNKTFIVGTIQWGINLSSSPYPYSRLPITARGLLSI